MCIVVQCVLELFAWWGGEWFCVSFLQREILGLFVGVMLTIGSIVFFNGSSVFMKLRFCVFSSIFCLVFSLKHKLLICSRLNAQLFLELYAVYLNIVFFQVWIEFDHPSSRPVCWAWIQVDKRKNKILHWTAIHSWWGLIKTNPKINHPPHIAWNKLASTICQKSGRENSALKWKYLGLTIIPISNSILIK